MMDRGLAGTYVRSVRTIRDNVGFGHTSRPVIRSARYHQESCPSAVVVVIVHKSQEVPLDRYHRARICGERMAPKRTDNVVRARRVFQEVAIARA